MTGYELLDFLQKPLKSLSKIGIKVTDCKYVPLYRKYIEMKEKGEKRDYIFETLSDEYGISVSSARRIIRRFSDDVKP